MLNGKAPTEAGALKGKDDDEIRHHAADPVNHVAQHINSEYAGGVSSPPHPSPSSSRSKSDVNRKHGHQSPNFDGVTHRSGYPTLQPAVFLLTGNRRAQPTGRTYAAASLQRTVIKIRRSSPCARLRQTPLTALPISSLPASNTSRTSSRGSGS